LWWSIESIQKTQLKEKLATVPTWLCWKQLSRYKVQDGFIAKERNMDLYFIQNTHNLDKRRLKHLQCSTHPHKSSNFIYTPTDSVWYFWFQTLAFDASSSLKQGFRNYMNKCVISSKWYFLNNETRVVLLTFSLHCIFHWYWRHNCYTSILLKQKKSGLSLITVQNPLAKTCQSLDQPSLPWVWPTKWKKKTNRHYIK
jgi:hypothetical protein